jgi:hypothetical protein
MSKGNETSVALISMSHLDVEVIHMQRRYHYGRTFNQLDVEECRLRPCQ